MNKIPFQLTLPHFTAQLKMMADNNLELLKKETTRLLGLQIKTLNDALETNNFLNSASPNTSTTEKQEDTAETVKTWISHLKNEQQKLDKLEMVLAVIGTMKAGKSTTINAIVGMEVLPNRETAMTTLPTLIRNKHGQAEPVLKIAKITPLLELSRKVAIKLQQLDEMAKSKIDLQGVEDGKTLIAQLIEQGAYPFKTEYHGQTGIFEFLKHLNDIMRLAKDEIIDIEPPYHEYENLDDLPVIEVEFCHLKDNKELAHGSLAILDTPGPNEFGQSAALRRVFKTQLEKASAILLVTDFTQMKTEADQGVREQLDMIKDQLSKDRLYVVVNKFDQANKNSMSKDDLKDYVAGSLMDGKVDIAQVFPVSSYYAYLANRAKGHLEQHEKLPCHKQEPWVTDFAETALGRRWESKIDDVSEVKACIDELWKDSFFAEPIEKVIKEAHATAANKSLDSAIKKLAYYNNEFLNILNLRSNAMSKDIREIEQMRQNLESDIKRCESVKGDVKKTTNACLSELEQIMGEVMKAQQDNIHTTIEKFFQDGKRTEKAQAEADKVSQNALKKSTENDMNPLGGIWGIFFSDLGGGGHKRQHKEADQLFDPNSPKINFSSNCKANKLTTDITKAVAGIFKDADERLNSTTNELIKKTTQSIAQQINEAVADTLKKAQEKLKNDGIALNFRLPDIDLTIDDIDASALFKAGYNEKTKTESRSRRQSGVWGGVCGFFGTSDWGWEDYDVKVTTYTVDLEKIKNQVIKQLNNQAQQLANQTGDYLRNIFQPNIDKHLVELVSYLTSYSRVLDDAIKSSELNKSSKTELIKQLASLLKTQVTIKSDIEAIKIPA